MLQYQGYVKVNSRHSWGALSSKSGVVPPVTLGDARALRSSDRSSDRGVGWRWRRGEVLLILPEVNEVSPFSLFLLTDPDQSSLQTDLTNKSVWCDSNTLSSQNNTTANMPAEEPKKEEPKKDETLGEKIRHGAQTVYDKTGLHKAMDATVFDKSPHGTNIDGRVEAHLLHKDKHEESK